MSDATQLHNIMKHKIMFYMLLSVKEEAFLSHTPSLLFFPFYMATEASATK